jgi:hypothetical protein
MPLDPGTLALLGAGGGALLGGLGGSSQAGTTTVTNDVPEWLRPYIQGALNPAQSQFNQLIGQGQSPILGASQDEFLRTIQGGHLDPRSNPFLQETFQQGANQIRGQLSPQFGHMQAFGGNSGANQALGRSLGEFATNLYGGNYNAERNRQFSATQGGPGFVSGASDSAFAPFNSFTNLLRGWGSQQTQPFFQNRTANVLGGALAGGALARSFA